MNHSNEPRPSVLALALVGLAALGACSKSDDHVHLLNGFDFPVTATITLESGDTETHKIPPRGRVTSSVKGKGTVKVVTESGDLVSENNARFGKADSDKKPCVRVFNVQGAAAIAREDVVFGTGFGTPDFALRAGWINDEYCTVTWAFQDPPEAISVDRHSPGGRNIGWLHYVDDGSWLTSVNALLEDKGQFKDQSRGRAQRIVKAVVAHDPSNPALAEVEARFKKEGLVYPKGGGKK